MIKVRNFTDFVSKIRVAFVGDIMQHEKQLEFERGRGFSYDGVFDEAMTLFSSCDLVIGNLETVLFREPYAGFPKFSAPASFANTLKRVGFDVLVTCNNHSLDQGEEGLKTTHEAVVSAGIVPLGTMGNTKQTFEIRGVKLTIHAYTTFMNKNLKSADVSFWNEEIIREEGFNIAYIHSGTEYSNAQNETQTKIENLLKSKGFDAVFFTHSHIPGKVSNERNFIKATGMGNFISDQMNLGTEKGICVILTLSSNRIEEFEVVKTSSVVKNDGETKIVINKN